MITSQLDPQLRSVGQLFDRDDATYTVPVYQRNYAWRAEQIEQLIGDVHDALAEGDDGYFLGNLIVTKRPGKLTDYEVIDGQQRLTTLFLLLTILANDGDGPYTAQRDRLRYESRPRATEALRRVTTEASRHAASLAENATNEDTGIHEGYNVIRQYLNQHPHLRDARSPRQVRRLPPAQGNPRSGSAAPRDRPESVLRDHEHPGSATSAGRHRQSAPHESPT